MGVAGRPSPVDQRMSPKLVSNLVGTRLRALASADQLPVYAPVAMAEEVAVMAYEEGAELSAAIDAGWEYLCSWCAHPSSLPEPLIDDPDLLFSRLEAVLDHQALQLRRRCRRR